MATLLASYSSSSSLYSPSRNPIWTYDVFLNFRGQDTRKNFVDHLHTALDQKGIFAFRDVESNWGQSIPIKILEAIEESRCAVVIFSRNYADSTWCLDELSKIVECKKGRSGLMVLPVFYDVDPSDVRRQQGSFKRAFDRHEDRFGDPERVQRWRAALTEVANLSGWNLRDGCEPEVIQHIVERIAKLNQTTTNVSKALVGMDSRLEKVLSYLDFGLRKDVRSIGIWGMAGIGKTTLAQVVFDTIRDRFEACSFLNNVREVTEKQGLVRLQEKLLLDLLQSNVNIRNTDMGKNVIRLRLRAKMVLIILDDVDQLEELEALCDHSWFGLGSRIIITSRDKHVLRTFGVDKIHDVEVLTDDEALKLFSWKAFKNYQVKEEYLELSKNVLKYANGLPLALEILGSFLCMKSVHEWTTVLDKLIKEGDPDRRIVAVIKISFDGLIESEKKIFLDIACFFKGEDIDRVTRILESCGYYPDIGIQVLIEKALVTVSKGKLWMHDLVQELGWDIVRRECREEPGRRSRLWLSEDIIPVLVNNEVTDAVEGIALDSPKLEEAWCDSEAFSKMHNLRFLQIRNVRMTEGPKFLSNALVFLEWSEYPTKFLPQSFQPMKLCELNLCYSSIEQLWNGETCLEKLRFINVSWSQNLTRTPDFTGTPNLQSIILEGCTNLVVIHPSIAGLKRLKVLNLKGCRSLKSLPNKIEMECLEILILSSCLSIKKIPEFVEPMEHLLELSLEETAIEKLPSSIEHLIGLTLLNLRNCKYLERLPRNICNLKSLKSLNICGCLKLKELPESLGQLDCLEELDVSGTSISTLPSSTFLMENLKMLSLHGCKGLPLESENIPLNDLSMSRNRTCLVGLQFPISTSGLSSLTELNLSDCNLQEGTITENLGCLFSLVSLNLSKNNFLSLPKSISHLSKLHNLNLESCKLLQQMPDLSPKVDLGVGSEGSNSLERLSSCFNYINCFELVKNQGCNNIAIALLRRFIQGTPYPVNRFETIIPGSEISEWFIDRSARSVVSMDLREDWCKKNWQGYVLCAVFGLGRRLPAGNLLGKWKYEQETCSTAHGLRCEVNPNNLGLSGWCPFFGCSQELGRIESDHIWLSFVGCEHFGTAWQDSCRRLEFLFKTLGPSLEVKKCGVRLIYEQEMGLSSKP
ncbi:PREDICTED: TMV resistance protein N-like isoform X2 [Prunus mume]|uniref:ADP-ribosyl cyclase/cyclic ADP-ribose hydrolase n=1 Tax=Prunus mume TaxID=102107 RepID=A0ABM1LSD2_PRUMU|nr:PREDICTED: TMV resistance protein N-like isoform X2 [Prunus mume]